MNTSEKPWFFAISAGRWQLSGIKRALDSGMNVFAIDGDPNASGFKIATKSLVVDIKDTNAVLSAIKNSGITPDGVVSFVSEVGMLSAAAVREEYGLTGPDKKLTNAVINKVKQRELWDKAGIPGPKWFSFNSITDVEYYAKQLGFPCIIKPSDSAGSRGVTKLDNTEGIKEAALIALAASNSGVGIIESYMDGIEYAIETFGDGQEVHVLAVTEKIKVPATNGTIAQELSTPCEKVKSEMVSSVAVNALKALGYLSGPGHTEIIMNYNGKVGLVEAAGRGGGFMVYERLVELASGFDIVKATALQAMGHNPEVVIEKNRAVVLRFFPSIPGEVMKLDGFSEANNLSGVEAGPFVSIGQQVGKVQGDGDRLGYILSEGETTAVAKSLADKAQSLINIEIS